MGNLQYILPKMQWLLYLFFNVPPFSPKGAQVSYTERKSVDASVNNSAIENSQRGTF